MTQRANSHLENMIDCQEQHSLRPILVVNGMTESSTEDNRDADNIGERNGYRQIDYPHQH